ncbi:MAG: HAMP domain-containing histidine kinase [Clostridia bacterium]|nr:HAMP domain-containing histidine kinase [Clostridia bacterium]
MIRRLQKKFIRITMCSAFAILFILLSSVNCIYIYFTCKSTNDTFETLIEHNGRFPSARQKNEPGRGNLETPFKTRYFAVQTDSAGNVQYLSVDKVASVNIQDALNITHKVLSKEKKEGTIGIYRYKIAEKYYGKLIIFIDCRDQLETTRVLIIGSFILMAFVMLVLFVLVYFFSGRAMQPVAESYDKQKQFITDAGHELKTPLSIISANTDVIEMCGDKSEWTESIRHQVSRMDTLIKNLIMLSRMDEQETDKDFCVFDISNVIADAAAPFRTLAQTQNRHFELSVQPDIKYNGNEEAIRRLVCVLCDNAVKYSGDGGVISVNFYRKNKNLIFSVFNTCENIDRKNLEKLFERFYRADSSRSRSTGGYGIGLSIAKAAADAHKGKIKAESTDGKSVTFTLTL